MNGINGINGIIFLYFFIKNIKMNVIANLSKLTKSDITIPFINNEIVNLHISPNILKSQLSNNDNIINDNIINNIIINNIIINNISDAINYILLYKYISEEFYFNSIIYFLNNIDNYFDNINDYNNQIIRLLSQFFYKLISLEDKLFIYALKNIDSMRNIYILWSSVNYKILINIIYIFSSILINLNTLNSNLIEIINSFNYYLEKTNSYKYYKKFYTKKNLNFLFQGLKTQILNLPNIAQNIVYVEVTIFLFIYEVLNNFNNIFNNLDLYSNSLFLFLNSINSNSSKLVKIVKILYKNSYKLLVNNKSLFLKLTNIDLNTLYTVIPTIFSILQSLVYYYLYVIIIGTIFIIETFFNDNIFPHIIILLNYSLNTFDWIKLINISYDSFLKIGLPISMETLKFINKFIYNIDYFQHNCEIIKNNIVLIITSSLGLIYYVLTNF